MKLDYILPLNVKFRLNSVIKGEAPETDLKKSYRIYTCGMKKKIFCVISSKWFSVNLYLFKNSGIYEYAIHSYFYFIIFSKIE